MPAQPSAVDPTPALTVAQALAQARQALAPHSDTAALDAQTLLAHITGRDRAWLLAHPEAPLTPAQRRALAQALPRLAAGEPLPYVLGRWPFYGRDFLVTPAVLIPRPETELLVEQALAWLHRHPGQRRLADVGTGSGCIAVTLAAEVPDAHVVAVDPDPAALAVARANAWRHAVAQRITWVQGDLLSALIGPFDLICANLPYIPTDQLAGLRVARYEPRRALDGGPDGLALIRRLLEQAPACLAPGGRLVLEIGSGQGAAAQRWAQRCFPHARVQVLPDYAGHDRLLLVDAPAAFSSNA